MHRIIYQVGGPEFHPVERQAREIATWLGDEKYQHERFDGLAAFERLDDADLLVLMGLHWTGGEKYQPLRRDHQKAFESYVASGRPIIAHHGAIASYDDWPRFGELVGFTWIWGKTNHSPIGEYDVRVLPTSHPIVAGMSDYRIHDELYYDIAMTPGLAVTNHAEAEFGGRRLPMIMTGTGGRIDGAGKVAYLANGHDMAAFACGAMKQMWLNAVAWALS
jgi:type 1 glutamine amidotransferase